MADFLAYFNVGLVINVAVFFGTLIFATKIKDWFRGIPSHLRSGLSTIETGVLTQVKQYETELVAKIVPSAATTFLNPKPPVPPVPPVS